MEGDNRSEASGMTLYTEKSFSKASLFPILFLNVTALAILGFHVNVVTAKEEEMAWLNNSLRQDDGGRCGGNDDDDGEEKE